MKGALRSVSIDDHGLLSSPDGLSELALAVYGRLRRCSGADPGELGAALGLTPAAVDRAVEELRAAHLVWLGVDGELLATDPYLALQRLADEQRQSLLTQQRDVERLRWAQHSVIRALHDVRLGEEDAGEVERLSPGQITVDRIRQLFAGARRSVHVVCPTALLRSVSPCAGDILRLCPPSLPVSLLVQRSMLANAETYETLSEFGARGLRLRVVDAAPLPFAVVDDTVAIAGVPDGDRFVPVAFRRHVAAGILRAVFDHLWSGGALPPNGHLTRVREAAAGGGLSAQQRQVLRLLASGIKDEAIARHLGVSLRTIRRIVAETMERLGVQSRFQAGLAAARLGLLECAAPAGSQSPVGNLGKGEMP